MDWSPLGLRPADFAAAVRLVRDLPHALHQPWTTAAALHAVRWRLANREQRWLAVARRIYIRPAHPYGRLLRGAGCELGDLERLVAREGLEGTLHALYCAGVFFSANELAGREPVVRGSARWAVTTAELHTPLTRGHLPWRTGGSSGAPRRVVHNLHAMRATMANHRLWLAARGDLEAGMAQWTVPGAQALNAAICKLLAGVRTDRWWHLVAGPVVPPPPTYRWSVEVVRLGARRAGHELPEPAVASTSDPRPVVEWLAAATRGGRAVELSTMSSVLVALCQTAETLGVSLAGVQFSVAGEPLTAARRALVARLGGSVLARYSATEALHMGLGCLQPDEPDHVHLCSDLFAFIQPASAAARHRQRPNTLLVTTLDPYASLTLLNASLGDEGQLDQHACGCALGVIGWSTRLHTIRGQEKSTAGGMSLLDADLDRILEERLPQRYGGGPADYQLVEAEDRAGRPRLWLRVHPRVGPLDEAAVAASFLAAIEEGQGVARLTAQLWRQAGMVEVEREPPYRTERGKVLHLHHAPPPKAPSGGACS